MRYAFTEEQRAWHCVRRLCELLEVSPADYYDCEVGRKAFGLPQTKKIREQIAQAHVESRGTYGRRRIDEWNNLLFGSRKPLRE